MVSSGFDSDVPKSAFAGLSEEQKELLIWQGMTLDMVQRAESTLVLVLNLVFHSRNAMTVESLEAEEGVLLQKTLGQLIKELQKRAEVDQGLEALLSDFLSSRNRFIHRLHEIKEHEGRPNALVLMKRLFAQSYQVARAMCAIFTFWAQGMEPQVEGLQVVLEEMQQADPADIKRFVPYIPFFIRPKGGEGELGK